MRSRHELLLMHARHADAGGFQLLQLVAQRARADAEALGGELAAAAGDAQRRQYQLALALLEVMVQSRLRGVAARRLDPASRCRGRRHAAPGRRRAPSIADPPHRSCRREASHAARCTMLVSSRALPGQSCCTILRSASADRLERRLAAARAGLNGAARQRQDVAAPLAQRRQPQRHHVEPVVQIGAEARRRAPLRAGRGSRSRSGAHRG